MNKTLCGVDDLKPTKIMARAGKKARAAAKNEIII